MKFLALLLISSIAGAATYELPDPDIPVSLFSGSTVVTLHGVSYHSISDFVYVSECTKPDSARYRCNIMQEKEVILFNGTETIVVENIIAQFASILNISGHNYWRQSQIVLSGEITGP